LQPTPVFDVYALGVMLYECLTGDPPFVSDNLVEILTRKAVEPAPSIATARRDLPASLVEFVHACVAIEPEQRPESAQAVVDRLGEILRELEHGQPRPLNVQPVAIGAAQTGTHKSAAAAAETHEHMLIGRTQDGTAQTIAAWNRQNHTKWITALGGIGVASVFVLAAWVWVTESSEPGVSTHDPNARAMASVASHRTEPVAEQPRTQRHLEPDPGEDATMVPAAAEPVGEALSEPAAAAVSPSVPRTRSKKTKDADCPAVRARATQAFSAHSWRDVLKFVARSSCWQGSHRPAYDEMRIRALFETGQFDACAEAGKRVKHTRTRQIVAACQKKRG
jgi:serine/threonine-protein kinase